MVTTDTVIWVDIAYKLAFIFGIIGAAFWGYFLYIKKRIGIWNLEMSVQPKQVRYSDKQSLLMIRVNLKNVGLTKITPGSKGCTVSIKQITPQDFQEYAIVNWKVSKCKYILEEHDILETYKYFNSKNYEHVYVLDPGCEYHEEIGIIVPHQYVYLIKVTFWERDTGITEYSHIYLDT